MQASGFTEQISLVIPTFHAVMPDAEDHERTAYPYPSLRSVGLAESREISVLTLENMFLKGQWAPSLGGRLVSCFDKREPSERFSPLRPVKTDRGDGLKGGVAVQIGGSARANDLGPVDAAQLDSEEAVGFILAETAAGSEVSWHQWVRLRDDTVVFEYEFRVTNRSRTKPVPMVTLSVPPGIAIDESWELTDGVAHSRMHPRELGPQSTAFVTARLSPISPTAVSYRFGERAIVTFEPEGWTIYALDALGPTRATLLIKTVDSAGQPSQTFEATVLLVVAEPLFLSRAELPPGAVDIAIREATGSEWWLAPAMDTETAEWSPVRSWPITADPAIYLNDPLLAHVAAIRLADQQLSAEAWSGVDVALDRALGTNAENPLAWWRRAARERLAGVDITDEAAGASLSNAHYLAPLEPLLRAEAFLNQSPEMGPEPSPLVKPMQGRPEHLVEVAARWLETGRADQATRWIDESLRHVESPMLLYLQAYAFLRAGRMEVEIPNLLRRASAIGYQPPFPYREIELEALTALENRFPDDVLIAIFRRLMA
jgi:hypothetical protein